MDDTADSESPTPPLRSESKAYWLATGSTLLGAPIGLGLIFGPSAGQYYCGSYREGNLGVVGRIAGVGLVTFGGLGAYNSSPGRGSPNPIFSIFIIAGIDLFIASTIYSFVDTRSACDRANQRLEENVPPPKDYGFEPSLQLSQSGSLQPGVNAWIHF